MSGDEFIHVGDCRSLNFREVGEVQEAVVVGHETSCTSVQIQKTCCLSFESREYLGRA